MTPTEQDRVEKYRSLIMNKHSNEWDMEKVSTVAHLCPDTEPIARKIANCKNYACTTCPDNAVKIADFITADRKRAALEARKETLDALDNHRKTLNYIVKDGAPRNHTNYEVYMRKAIEVDTKIAELKAQQEETQ